jgi:hypothetical protein
MRNPRRQDPSIAKVMRASANAQTNRVLHFSLTVGKRVVTHSVIRPQNNSEFIRLKANRGLEEGVDAVTATIQNSEEGCFGTLFIDGRMLKYGIEKFGRDIEFAWLRINNKPVQRVFSEEGMASFLKSIGS